MRKAVFLDKDGVINSLVKRDQGELTSPWTLEEFINCIFPEVKESIEKLKKLDYLVFVVTNQPGVLDGNMLMTELDEICSFLEEEYGIDHVLYALKKNTGLYKPNNGMIESLIRIYEVDPENSFMVGDRWKDIVPGHKSNLKTIYVGSDWSIPEEYNTIEPDFKVSNLKEAVNVIENFYLMGE